MKTELPLYKVIQAFNAEEIETLLNKWADKKYVPFGDLVVSFKPQRHVSCGGYESGFVGDRIEGSMVYTQVMKKLT